MSATNQDILEMLRELVELAILDEGDPQSFRVRAYESASRGVEGHGGDLAKLSVAELAALEGIGKSTAAKIREFVDTGRVQKLEELRIKHPPSVLALLRLPGVGPKAVQRLRSELNVQSIDDLKAALAGRKLREVKGFGQKTEEKLLAALARLEKQGEIGRTPISVALPLAERLVARLLEVPGVSHASYCGSLRRFSETVGDLDVIVAASDPAGTMNALVAMPIVDRVLVQGEGKTSFVTARGMQVDVRVVAPHQLGAARLYFTGSKGHNIKLRQRALARKWTLNEYALAELETGNVIASETEEQIYAALGLPWIPPHLREDQGEIEAAEAGTLPRPLGDPIGDFHVHTNTSGDARSTLEDTIVAAITRGCRVLAITDHAENSVAGATREAFLRQRELLRTFQTQLGDRITLLHGVELNIGPNGELDYDDEFRRSFDWCLASVHDHFDLDRAAQTRRIVTAMEDPSVRMIGHLSARMIGARPPLDLDLDAVLDAAERTGTALEINGGLPRLDMSVEALRRARSRNVTFVLTSDAHQTSELERVEHARKNAERAWVDPARVVNVGDAEALRRWALGGKGKGQA